MPLNLAEVPDAPRTSDRAHVSAELAARRTTLGKVESRTDAADEEECKSAGHRER